LFANDLHHGCWQRRRCTPSCTWAFFFFSSLMSSIHNPCVGERHLGLRIVTCRVEILCVLGGFCNSFVIDRNVAKGSKGFAYVSLVFVVPRYLGPHNFLSHCNSPPLFVCVKVFGFFPKMIFDELVDYNVFMRTLPISSETLFFVAGSLSLSISLCMCVSSIGI
jgi:hypothetical protein